uniref:Uncharacterized protein n=1 Tax=Romanomermis culicivorax TaxID=13658 RepID=A0A915HGR1_ROMCU
MTDIALLENPEKNPVILTFIDYYVFKQKYQTLTLTFINRKINLDPSSDVVKTAVDISNMWERMDERLDVIEEDEEEEKAWAEYRKQMDFLEDLLSLRPE